MLEMAQLINYHLLTIELSRQSLKPVDQLLQAVQFWCFERLSLVCGLEIREFYSTPSRLAVKGNHLLETHDFQFLCETFLDSYSYFINFT